MEVNEEKYLERFISCYFEGFEQLIKDGAIDSYEIQEIIKNKNIFDFKIRGISEFRYKELIFLPLEQIYISKLLPGEREKVVASIILKLKAIHESLIKTQKEIDEALERYKDPIPPKFIDEVPPKAPEDKILHKEKIHLQGLWPIINKADWESTSFNREKAYLCCNFSRLAYLEIPDYELKNSKRIKLVPCSIYQELIKTGKSHDLKIWLTGTDFNVDFIITREFAIIIGFRIKNILIVCIRGTANLYDVFIDLKFKIHTYSKQYNIKFHLGFYKAISECFEDLFQQIRINSKENCLTYITGHSLGGAMGAILYTLWTNNLIGTSIPTYKDKISCYSFGMPKYGNKNFIINQSLYHIYNPMDMVPRLPPTWLGYKETSHEYSLNDLSFERKMSREKVSIAKWVINMLTMRIFRNHGIELYGQNIEKHL